jgi:hypothetical protein
MPFVGLVATLAVYAAATGSPLSQLDPTAIGAEAAFVLWLLIAAIQYWVIRGTSADQVNNSAFSELRHALGEITARFSVANPGDEQGRIAAQQVQDSIKEIRTELERSGPAWVIGTGYVSVWKLVHRAEEALLLLEPITEVIAAGLYDELRLMGSQMDNSDQLLSKLRVAVAHLSSDAASYLTARPSTTGPAANGAPPAAPDSPAMLARVALREVRQTVNEFRDNGWDAIVRTRNHLVATLTATGIATYFGLVLAITVNTQERSTNIQSNAVVAAAAFYLVGAMIGLFNRLNGESTTQNDVEDYGLTTVRLILTPVLAGIAAVAGVFLSAMAAGGVSAAIPGSPPSGGLPMVWTVFNLTTNPFALVLAAVFGLSPGLLINGIQAQAEKYKTALKSTNAQGQ